MENPYFDVRHVISASTADKHFDEIMGEKEYEELRKLNADSISDEEIFE
ncbi:hypothetical protein [Bacillus mycoides]